MDPAAGPARTIPFLTPALAAEVRARFGTPCYVYDRADPRGGGAARRWPSRRPSASPFATP